MKILFDASPLLVNKTGVGYYTERVITEMANQFPDINLHGFYYNFLARRDSSVLPKAKNISYTNASLIPSKIVFQLRRLGVEVPVEVLALTKGDFIIYDNFLSHPSLFMTPSAPVIHDLTYIDLPEYVSAKLRKDLVRFVPKAINRSSFVITVSEFCKKRIHEVYKVPLDKILVTHIPPSKPKLHNPDECREFLEETGLSKSYILFLGTVEPRKNITQLIDGYTSLPKALRDKYTLVIAGMIGWNCEKEKAKLQQVRTEGYDVVHLGYVSEEHRSLLYQNATIFAHASHYEGFGMPVLEAMSYGLPCALSNIPIFKEVAGDAGVYFDEKSVDSISRTISKLLTDKNMAKQKKQQALYHASSYSWNKVASELYRAIDATL